MVTDLRNNVVSYVFLPFYYQNQVSFDNYLGQRFTEIEPINLKNNLYLSFIDSLFAGVTAYRINIGKVDFERDWTEVEFFYFKTGVGFLAFKFLNYTEKIPEVTKRVNEGEYPLFSRFKEILNEAEFFLGYSTLQCLTLNIGSKKNPDNTFLGEGCGDVKEIDSKLHIWYGSTQKLSIISDIDYSTSITVEKEQEDKFWNQYSEDYFLLLFLLLHHERQEYLLLRKKLVENDNWDRKTIKGLKREIIELITNYSYKIVTEDIELHKLYTEYRQVLNLTDYEETLSDLVEKLDDENERNLERKFTFISIVIALMSVASIVTDLINFFR